MINTILKNKLIEKELSLRDAGRLIGVSHTTLARVINGENIDLGTLEKISEWLGIPLSTALNSRSEASPTALRLSAILDANPRLADTFETVLQQVDVSQIPVEIMEEILSYLTFKISQYAERI